MPLKSEPKVVCIGAGPAGLTAAYQLCKDDIPVLVLEKHPNLVGGIARTEQYKGYLFDIGGHRFFSKSKEIEDLWEEVLGEDFITRDRSSKIYYRKKFFSYPLRPFGALTKLGLIESAHCVLSYLYARIFPKRNPKNFEDWVTNKFGRRLFSIFFKTYTEKVWGMSCKEISADWAAQRIKGLSLSQAILAPLKRNKGKVIKSLISSFRYPRKGPGMMWEKTRDLINKSNGKVELGCKVTSLSFDRENKMWTVHFERNDRMYDSIKCEHVISSAPIAEIVPSIDPKPEVSLRAQKLSYRDFIIVALITNQESFFEDQWLYIHDPSVTVGRIQNFKSWSPELVPNTNTSCYGMEYFCFEHDKLWESSDQDLIDMAKAELEEIGVAKKEDVIDGCVVRQEKAYPVYDEDYASHVEAIREELEKDFPGLHLVGRNGMHKYNNQDHAMMTALITARNIAAGRKVQDVWLVNQDAAYLEESSLRLTPKKISE